MALVVNTNIGSLNAQRQLNNTTNEMATAMERLSSGKRINSASDDAAGLAIATRMTSQVKGLTMAIRNANDGVSIVQTAEGAMDEITNMLQRMRELALQSGNTANNDADRASLNDEVVQLQAEIDRISSTTQFNSQNLLDGTYGGSLQIGDQADQNLSISIQSVATTAMGETVSGLATQASSAVLTVGGVSTDAADYQGKSFQVSVNGTTATVTLPTSSETTATAATTSATIQGEDYGAATSAIISNDSYSQNTLNLTDAASRVVALRTDNTDWVNVDFTDELANLFGVTVNALDNPELDTNSGAFRVTADQFVTVVQEAIDSKTEFQGDNRILVSVSDRGYIEFSDTSGNKNAISLREGLTSSATSVDGKFIDRFIDDGIAPTTASVVTAQDNTSQRTAELGTIKLDMTDDKYSAFDIKVNDNVAFVEIDLLSRLNDSNYVLDRESVTAGEFINVLQDALDAEYSGDDRVTVSFDDDGKLNFDVAGGLRSLVIKEGEYNNAGTTTTSDFVSGFVKHDAGDTTEVTIHNDSREVNLTTAFTTSVLSVTEEYGEDDFVINVRVNDGVATDIDLVDYLNASVADVTKAKGNEIVAALQAAFDDNFTGDDAITVSLNASGVMEFTVAKESGSLVISEGDVNLDGTYGDFVKTFIHSDTTLDGDTNDSDGTETTAGTGVNSFFEMNQALQTEDKTAGANITVFGTKISATNSTGVVDFANQTSIASGNRKAVFDDVASYSTLIAGTTATTAATGTQTYELILDDGVAEVTVTAAVSDGDLVSAIGTALSTALGNLTTDESSRYTITSAAGGGNDFAITHKDGRVFSVRYSGDHDAAFDDGTAGVGTTEYGTVRVFGTTTDMAGTTPYAGDAYDVSGTAYGNVGITIDDADTYAITFDGAAAATGTVTIDEGTYTSLEALAASIQHEIDASALFQGNNAVNVVVREYTDENAASGSGVNKYLAFESAFGRQLEVAETTASSVFGTETDSRVDDTSLFEELGISPDETNYALHSRVDGGVDTTAENGLINFSVQADGNTYSYQIALTQNANMTFADFADELMTQANSVFAAHGVSFSGGLTGDTFSIAMDEAGDNNFSISGAIIDDAFGGSLSASGTAASANLGSMADVEAAMADDLAATGLSVTFDHESGEFTFADESGTTGVDSTIEISGADLADMQFAGTLTATGEASDATASKLSAVDVSTVDGATAALTSIDNSLEYVSSQRSALGAIENRLNYTINNLSNVVENTAAARSRIEDADFAVEAANLAKYQVMQQAGTAMLAQANAASQTVLSLLG